MITIKTVDYLLLEINSHLNFPKNEISVKDKRILLSLSKQVSQGNFLTENQANLLLKIFKENINFITSLDPDAENIIKSERWSREFRVIEKIRKIFLRHDDETKIAIQFTYDKRLKTKLADLSKKINGAITTVGSKEYHIAFTEKNIFAVVAEFFKDQFDIDEKILIFYQEIKEIAKTNKDYYNVFSLKDEKFKKLVEANVGSITLDNLLKLHDRKIRYGYNVHEKIHEISLINAIAQRKKSKIFINSQTTSFDDIIGCLQKLDRLPLLVIFDGHDAKSDRKSLEIIENSVNSGFVDNSIGIYFRYDKEADGDMFNKAISSLKYNRQLDPTTSIAGISNNKIPKFMIKSGWKPQTIISFTNNFRNNKSSTYFSDVDLIIFYGLKQPIHGNVDAFM